MGGFSLGVVLLKISSYMWLYVNDIAKIIIIVDNDDAIILYILM